MLKITFQWLVNDEPRWLGVVCSFDSLSPPLCFSLYSLMMCNMQSVVPRAPSRRVYNDWYDPGCRSRACARTLLLASSSWYVLLQTWCTRSRYAVVPGNLLSTNCISLCRFYAGLASIWERLDDAATGKRVMWYSFVNWSAMLFARRLTLWYQTQSL